MYLPVESMNNIDIFLEKLGKIESIIQQSDLTNVCIMGDFNRRPDGVFSPLLYNMTVISTEATWTYFLWIH